LKGRGKNLKNSGLGAEHAMKKRGIVIPENAFMGVKGRKIA